MTHAAVIVALDDVDTDNPNAVEHAVSGQMEPFDEKEAWFEDGSRWDWWQIGGRFSNLIPGQHGSIVRRGDLNPARLHSIKHREIEERYADAVEAAEEGEPVQLLFGFDPSKQSLGEYKANRLGENGVFSAYAFLRNRTWYEKERMGWFGSPAKSECEIRGEKPNICKYEDENAKIVSYQGEDDWHAKYWDRFIADLDDDVVLIVVDYHV